jgi:hypothetical protein
MIATRGKQRLRLSVQEPSGVEVNALGVDTLVWKILNFKVLEGTPQNFISAKLFMRLVSTNPRQCLLQALLKIFRPTVFSVPM